MAKSVPRLILIVNRCFLGAVFMVSALGPAWADSAPLEGRVEETGVAPTANVAPKPIEPMPVPVMKPRAPLPGKLDDTKLQSGAEKDALNGQVDDAGAGGPLQPVEGKPDPNTGRLKATVAKDESLTDPDSADQELMVEWDRWRNRLMKAIYTGMSYKINEPNEQNMVWSPKENTMVPRYPLGTGAWFAVQVTPDLRIRSAKIIHSSGYPAYDQTLIEAIMELDGTSILRYPRGSRRKIVSHVAGLKTAETAEFRYQKFGDVERRILPGNY